MRALLLTVAALLLSATLAHAVEKSAIDAAVDRGVAALKKMQRTDGTWSYDKIGATGLAGLVMFGSMAIYFADLQFRVSYPGRIATWAVAESVDRVLALGATANNMRWFFLIVLLLSLVATGLLAVLHG